MRVRRVSAAVAALALGLGVLTGCSPGDNGVAGIGFDAQGHLIGGAKVCRADTGSSGLYRGGVVLGEWTRSSKGHGSETWALAAVADGQWRATAPNTRDGTTSELLTFRVDSWGGGWYASVQFTAAQLAAVPPGHLLVGLDGPPTPEGYGTRTTAVVALEDLARQPCPAP